MIDVLAFVFGVLLACLVWLVLVVIYGIELFRRSKKGYKLCRNENNRLISYYVGANEVEYFINKWISRPNDCGPLVVFDSLENLLYNFFKLMNYYKIFECEYVPSKDKKIWKKNIHLLFPEDDDYLYVQSDLLPKGSILADKVKIIKEIEI